VLRRNVLALFGGLLLWTGVHFGLLALLPLALHDQGYDARSIGLVLAAAGLAQLSVRPFGGWIVDAFGRRRPLVLSLVLMAGASALLLVPAGWAVAVNRLLTGIAFSLGTTAFYTLTLEVAPPGRVSEVQGYVALGLTFGVALGPFTLLALYQGLVPGGASPLVLIAGVAAVASLVSAVCFSTTSSAFQPLGRRHPYSLRANFRREGLLPAFLNCCAQVANSGFSSFLPLWAIGRGVGNPGILFVGSQAGAVASRLFSGRLADRLGRRAVLLPALAGVAATLAALGVVTGLPAFFALAVVYGALFGVVFVILPGLAGGGTPASARGAALNTFGLGADAAQLLGPWGLGLAAGTWGFGGALVAAAAVSLFGAVAYLGLGRRGPAGEPATPVRAPAA
jgi:MFS family permease